MKFGSQLCPTAKQQKPTWKSLPVAFLRTPESANQPFRDLAAEMDTKVGNVFGFLRDSITAQKVSPPVFETMEIVGREKVMERIKHGIELLETLQ